MDVKQILIRIRSEFQKEALEAGKTALQEFTDLARRAAKESVIGMRVSPEFTNSLIQAGLQLSRTGQIAGETMDKLRATMARPTEVNALNRINTALIELMGTGTISLKTMQQLQSALRGYGKDAAPATSATSKLSSALQGLRGAAQGAFGQLQSLAKGGNIVSSALGGLTSRLKILTMNAMGWNSVFGRVTIGMLTWQAWRTVTDGFGFIADAIVGANARLQTAQQMFTALSAGSKEMGQNYIDIVKQLAIQSGASIDQLLAGAKRLPTQVGQNFVAFSDLIKKAIVLGILDPVQGVEGAFYALSNFLEGTAAGAKSLITRFELFNKPLVKKALEEAKDPVEALQMAFEAAGIDVDLMIDQLGNTLPVAVNGLKSMFQEFFRILGEPVITQVTEDLIGLRNWVRDNQDAMQGLAQALGAGAAGAFQRFRGFIGELLGLDDFSPMKFFEAGVELMTNLADGMFTALTDYVIPTIVQIAEIIAGFFIGASPPPMGPLSQIREGGEETIKQYVLGLVSGLNSEAIKSMAQEIVDNIISLEAQELAQEKSINALENWVDEAQKATQAARDKLRLFDIQTEDIPERFTRGRRRQLELEILAAETEERRRKESLEAAKEQLKATKDFLQVQKRILSTLEQQAKAQEKAEKAAEDTGKMIDRSLQFPEGFDASGFAEQVAKWKEIFQGKLQPLFEEMKQGLGEIADFVRGIFGADPDSIRGITQMYEAGERLRDAFFQIKEGLDRIVKAGMEVFTAASNTWKNMDPGLKKLIEGTVLALAFPKLSLLAGLTLELADPGNVKGILLMFAGVLGAGAGGAVINLGQMLAKFTIIPVGKAAIAFFGGLATVIGGGAAGASVLVLPVTILAGLILWKGKDIFKTVIEIGAILHLARLKLGEKVSQFLKEKLGIDIDLSPNADVWAETYATAIADVEKDVKQPWEYLWGALSGLVAGKAEEVKQAVDAGFKDPTIQSVQETADKVVFESIVPDMLRRIVTLFTALPGRLMIPLTALRTLIFTIMTQIRVKWTTDWMAMVQVTVASVNAIQAQLMRLQQLQATAMASMLQFQQAQAALLAQQRMTAIQSQLANMPFIGNQLAERLGITIQMDANETRSWLNDGVYSGMLDVFGNS